MAERLEAETLPILIAVVLIHGGGANESHRDCREADNHAEAEDDNRLPLEAADDEASDVLQTSEKVTTGWLGSETRSEPKQPKQFIGKSMSTQR